MDLVLAFKAVVMGVVEGLTEFLPVSSTGHLILTDSLLNFQGQTGKETADTFEIAIQAGAIVAVMWEYRKKIAEVLAGLFSDAKAQRFALNLVVAFLPAAVLGVLFIKKIKAHLFNPLSVASAFIIGALVILWVERRHKNGAMRVRIDSIDDMTLMDAFKVGCAQAFGLIPGTSRSGATIMGAMLFGMSRRAATEFSFFLAIPTLLGATAYSLFKARDLLTVADVPLFTIGTAVSFIAAFLCVRWLLRYISSHDFTFFAWYRIAFGLVVLGTWYSGTVAWTA